MKQLELTKQLEKVYKSSKLLKQILTAYEIKEITQCLSMN